MEVHSSGYQDCSRTAQWQLPARVVAAAVLSTGCLPCCELTIVLLMDAPNVLLQGTHGAAAAAGCSEVDGDGAAQQCSSHHGSGL